MTFKIYERKDQSFDIGNPLTFIISHNYKTYKVFTGVHCKPGSWDQRSQTVLASGKDQDPKARQKNKLLADRSEVFEKIAGRVPFNIDNIRKEYESYIKGSSVPESTNDSELILSVMTPKQRDKFIKGYQKSTNKDFFLSVEKLLYDNRDIWSDDYKANFRTIRYNILKYDPSFSPSHLTVTWWKEFCAFCIEKGNVSNTISKYTDLLIRLMKEWRKMGYVFENNLEDQMNWGYIEPKVLPLSWDKILKIRDCSTRFDKTQVLCTVAAFTGRRWDEVAGMDKSHFYQRGDTWFYYNFGKGQASIEVRLIPEAVEYLKSIDFILPRMDQQTVNWQIKRICEDLGFNEKLLVITPIKPGEVLKQTIEEYKTVHFHTFRHSFIANALEKSKDLGIYCEDFVMELTAHKSKESFRKYANLSDSLINQMYNQVFKK